MSYKEENGRKEKKSMLGDILSILGMILSFFKGIIESGIVGIAVIAISIVIFKLTKVFFDKCDSIKTTSQAPDPLKESEIPSHTFSQKDGENTTDDQQSQLSERFRLEQSIAGLVGGKTGLLMYLDVLMYDVEEKRHNAFRSHVQDYLQKANALEKVIERYEKLVPQDPSLKLYQNLLAVGKDLKEITDPRFNETLTDEQLDCRKKDILQRIKLYKEEGGDV